MDKSSDDHLASDDPAYEGVVDPSEITPPSVVNRAEDQVPMAEWARKLDLERQIAEFDAHILGIQDHIKNLNAQLMSAENQKEELVRRLREIQRVSASASVPGGVKRMGIVSDFKGIDYMDEGFDWMGGLRARMKSVFGINEFRLCQRGICNANMDRRDIVVVMPTGGGKSLTYQLPALFTPGCTLVISPLISLITDQILHLQGHGINAVALTGATPLAQKKEITRQLMTLAERRPLQPGEEEIKLCYITPEKLAKDTQFVMLLQKLMTSGKLARVVIDEAHCVSQMGHDFRPDYQKLHQLRQMLPSVPIMALSATCPPLVLKDLLKTLRLPDIVDGRNAKPSGTVYFFSPLYRKNLHYCVVPKPSKASDVTKEMVDYILEHHPNDSGIVYCLSKKNSEKVAQELRELSDGKIRTGIYHADRQGDEKSELHQAWREGKVKVVCATIAFGLGIDKGDVRFVLHHSMSKSLEGYYQESGRAGRDGKDADCVLYYRPQDGSTISSMVFHDKSGTEKLHAMLDFAEDLEQCRKIQFAKYFSHSSNMSISSWSTEDQDVLERCGHCDNCTRPPETIECKDVSLYSWQLLQIANYIHNSGGKATVNMLAGLARNVGGGAFDVSHGKRKGKEKVALALDDIAGGMVDLSRDEIEHLIIRLLIKGYFKEEYQQTAYSTNVYIVPGMLANRFIHTTRENIEKATRPMIQMTVSKQTPKVRRRRQKNIEDRVEDAQDTPFAKKRKVTTQGIGTWMGRGKEKQKKTVVDLDFDDDFDFDDLDGDHSCRTIENRFSTSTRQKKNAPARGGEESECEVVEIVENPSDDEDDSDDVVYGWSTSLRQEPTARRKRVVGKRKHSFLVDRDDDDDDVLVLSSD